DTRVKSRLNVIAVLGGQWGDEGKGKVVDLLADRFSVVARYHGGHNAGHTVKFGDRHFALHLLPSGVLRGRVGVIGSGVVVDPDALLAEISAVEAAGVAIGDNLKLSDRAHVILPHHRILDGAREKAAGDAKLGTTLRGIGPAYESAAARRGIRVAELFRPEVLRPRVEAFVEEAGAFLRALGVSEVPGGEETVRALESSAEKLRRHVTDTGRLLRDHLAAGGTLLGEGAHGAMLDLCAGTYPFVTSSHCTAAGMASGLQIPPAALDASVVVLKAYTTRVGSGPFPTELDGEIGEFLRRRGNEVGTSTGRPRRTGWFDAVVGRTAVELSGAAAIALTKLDVLDELREIPVCVGYRVRGASTRDVPALVEDLAVVEPIYERLPGWETTTTAVTRPEQLPKNAQRYVRFIEEKVGARAILVSTGPRREETMWYGDSPLFAALPERLPGS
ncbi:MAG TPA: adenylosuccinate synthase, partial [Thermoanaerobaculia bacterium]|nr:adenylosuccinate synthase [Thermoanaerobaculia bacterium]